MQNVVKVYIIIIKENCLHVEFYKTSFCFKIIIAFTKSVNALQMGSKALLDRKAIVTNTMSAKVSIRHPYALVFVKDRSCGNTLPRYARSK